MTPRPRLCAVCQSPDVKVCANCTAIWYCGEKCQKLDWKESHKLICGPYVTFMANNPRPADSGYKLAIQFPVDATVPTLSWLRIGDISYLENDDEAVGSILHGILPNGQLFKLKESLAVHYRDSFLFDGSAANLCVSKMLKGIEDKSYWRGPIFAGTGDTDADIVPEDLRRIVEFFRWSAKKKNSSSTIMQCNPWSS